MKIFTKLIFSIIGIAIATSILYGIACLFFAYPTTFAIVVGIIALLGVIIHDEHLKNEYKNGTRRGLG